MPGTLHLFLITHLLKDVLEPERDGKKETENSGIVSSSGNK